MSDRDLQAALRAVVNSGQASEAYQYLLQTGETAQAAYSQIRSNYTLSDYAKMQQLATVTTQYGQQALTRLEGMVASDTAADRQDVEKVFGLSGLMGDYATLTISRRDALDRAGRCFTEAPGSDARSQDINGSRALADLLTSATRSGDEVLARACAQTAMEKVDIDTFNAFLADRPALAEAADRLWSRHTPAHPTVQIQLNVSLAAALSSIFPTELPTLERAQWALAQPAPVH